MSAFRHDDTITTEDVRRLESIAAQMTEEGLPDELVQPALAAAMEPRPGLIDAFFDWEVATSALERKEIVAEIERLIRD